MSCPYFKKCPILKNKAPNFICVGYIKENPYYVYIVECLDGTYYTGYTNNLNRRMKEHKSGRGSRWCKAHGFRSYSYIQCGFSKDARRIERKIKRWSKKKKKKVFDLYGHYL